MIKLTFLPRKAYFSSRNDPLNVSIWNCPWFSQAPEVDPCLVMVRPEIKKLPEEFGSVVDKKIMGKTPVRDQSI